MKRAPQPKRVALAKIKDDLSRYLRLAASEEIVITRHGRPAGVLIGFESEEDWFEYRLEHLAVFRAQCREAGAACAAGRGVRLEDLAE
jgi:prevent-host-death family protein